MFSIDCVGTYGCPLDWVFEGNFCYFKNVSGLTLSYLDARDACKDMEAELTSIRDEEEQNFLFGEYCGLITRNVVFDVQQGTTFTIMKEYNMCPTASKRCSCQPAHLVVVMNTDSMTQYDLKRQYKR